eukprot:GGOE01065159.1.p1 GENE.GGOE01065159.1~~GGOE01065159.1.p1  ORF type:complete len:236 (+),score=92.28 GGOE01065159.1:112-819(+)
MALKLDWVEVQALRAVIGSADEDPLPKLTACFKVLQLFHTQPFHVLGRLSHTLASDAGVVAFLIKQSNTADPMIPLTLQLMGYMAGASGTVRKQLLAAPGFLGGLLGILRGARYEPLLMTSVIGVLSQVIVGQEPSRQFSVALGNEFSLLTLLATTLADSATYRHLRLPILSLLLCLMHSAEGQLALRKKHEKVREALQTVLTEQAHPLTTEETKAATRLTQEIAVLFLTPSGGK